jgi:hypothetical protein
MCNVFVPPISLGHPMKALDYKLNNRILKFLKENSGSNITQITGIKKQKCLIEPRWHDFTDEPMMPEIHDRLIIECRCINGQSFENSGILNQMVTAAFKGVLGVSDIQLEYHYSMYYCRD